MYFFVIHLINSFNTQHCNNGMLLKIYIYTLKINKKGKMYFIASKIHYNKSLEFYIKYKINLSMSLKISKLTFPKIYKSCY